MSSQAYATAQHAMWSRVRSVVVAFLVAAMATATLSALSAAPASAAGSRYSTVASCDNYKYYLMENGTLDCSDDGASWVTVGDTGQPLNALAYDAVMGSLIATKINTNRLYTIAGDGTVAFVGVMQGIPTGLVVTGGDVDPATDTYYVNTADNRFFSVNLTTLVATELTSYLPFNLGADLVVEGGHIWSMNNDSGSSPQYLEGFNLSDYSTISISVGISDTGPAGAQWSDVAGGGDGIVWFANSSGKTYKSNSLSTGGTTPSVIGRNLTFSVPIDGATFWSLAPINGSTNRGDSQVQVSWDPSPSVNPNAIYIYTVNAYDPQGNFAGSCSYSTATDSGYTCTVTGLTNGTPYTFKITATNFNNGSQTSATFGPATPATTPSVPLNVAASSADGGLNVTWDSSASNGGEPIDSYTATAYDADGNAVGTCTYTVGDSPANACTITGLTNGTGYTIKVTAHNVIGNGPPGSPSSATPIVPAAVPSAPNNVSAQRGNGSATISWTVPNSDGGASITSYTATAYDADGNVAGTCTYTGNDPTGTMSCTISGLTNGSGYTFKVNATNRMGDGPPSSPVGPITPATVPSVPNNVGATTGPGSATISWTVPDSNGGSSITGYTVTAYDPDGNVAGTCTYTGNDPSAPMSCDISGLSNGTDYTFKVNATNGVGDGPQSGAAGPYTTPSLPGTPNDVTVDGGNGSATISWNIPDSDGGSDITGYTVTAYDANGNVAGTCTYTGNNPTGTMSCTIDGLTNGSSYTFKVDATNGVGDGPQSGAVGPVTPATVPSAPNNVGATTGPGSATISWNIPDSDGGSDITGYTVTAYDADGNVAGTCTYTGNNPTGTMSCDITGLDDGAPYTFKVNATNRVGDGPQSGAAGPVTTPDVPSAPNNVTFSGGSAQGSADISWTIPDSDGGADITGYKVTAYDADGNVAGTCTYTGNNPTGTMSCTITGLTLGSRYTFKVNATNGVGDGPPSSPIGPYLISSWSCSPGEQIAMVNGAFYRTTDFNQWTTLSSGNEIVNALAFNSNDGFVYGLVQKGSERGQLDRVSGNGSVTRMGKIAGLPKATYLAGSIDQATGYYYVSSQNQVLWRINLANRTATQAFVPRVPPRFGADLLVQDGAVWTMTTTRIYSYNLDGSGQPSIWWLPKGHRNLHLGGLSMDASGRLIVMGNQNGNVYRIDGFNHSTVNVTDIGDFTSGVPMGLDVDLTACSL